MTANRFFVNVLIHILILNLRMVGSKCINKSDWVFVCVFEQKICCVVLCSRKNVASEPSYRVGISAVSLS